MDKSECMPLMGGGSAVTYSSTKSPDMTNSFGTETSHTHIQSKITGLLSDADEKPARSECWGWDDSIISAFARLPFVHTFTVLSFFMYFGHVWLLMQHPALAVGIVLFFVTYGCCRFWIMWVSAFHGIVVLRKFDQRDPNYWRYMPRPGGASISFDSVWHVVMVPSYKEPINKLRQTLDTIADQSIAKQIVVCVAMEARDPHGAETAQQLEIEYGSRLGGFCFALHPLREGEVAGKSSNENWAARCIKKKMVDELRVNWNNIILTTCDADTFFHNNYFAAVTHYFILDGDNRFNRFYLPVTNFMPNIYAVPAICGTRFTVLSVGRLAEMANPMGSPLPLAIYSVPMRLAYDSDYWDPKVIPEDWHMYFRCVFAKKGNVEATRVMLTVGTEAVEGKNYFDTIKETYDQSVRWQWGAIDLGYLIMQAFSKWDVPLYKRAKLLLIAYDHHLFAVTMGICLMSAPFLYGRIPVELETDVWSGAWVLVLLKTVMIWIWITHLVLHFTFLCVADAQLRSSVLRDRMHFYMDGESSQGYRRWLDLMLFPFADIFLFLIPTLHAHTRMFYSPQFNYVPSAKNGGRRLCPSPTDICGGGDTGVVNDDEGEIVHA